MRDWNYDAVGLADNAGPSLPAALRPGATALPGSKVRRAAVVACSLVALSAAGGTAFAVWSTSGAGTGSAVATTSKPLEPTATASVAGLYPGATLTGGSIDVKNPNAFAVTISSRSFGTATVTKATGAPAGTCTATSVTFTPSGTQPTSIPAGQTVAVPFSATMSSSAEDACQGATFTATLTISGANS